MKVTQRLQVSRRTIRAAGPQEQRPLKPPWILRLVDRVAAPAAAFWRASSASACAPSTCIRPRRPGSYLVRSPLPSSPFTSRSAQWSQVRKSITFNFWLRVPDQGLLAGTRWSRGGTLAGVLRHGRVRARSAGRGLTPAEADERPSVGRALCRRAHGRRHGLQQFLESLWRDAVRRRRAQPGSVCRPAARHNYQSGLAVFGVQADLTGANLHGTATCMQPGLSVPSPTPTAIHWRCFRRDLKSEPDWFGTLTGRAGLAAGAQGRMLLYSKGGLAWIHDGHRHGGQQHPA